MNINKAKMELLTLLSDNDDEIELLDQSSGICEKSMKLLMDDGFVDAKYSRHDTGFVFVLPRLTSRGYEMLETSAHPIKEEWTLKHRLAVMGLIITIVGIVINLVK